MISNNNLKPLIIKRSFHMPMIPSDLYIQFATEFFDKEYIPVCILTFKDDSLLVVKDERDICGILDDIYAEIKFEEVTLSYLLYKNYKNFFMKLKELSKESIIAEIAFIENKHATAFESDLYIMKQYLYILHIIFAINLYKHAIFDVYVHKNMTEMGGEAYGSITITEGIEEIVHFYNGKPLLINIMHNEEEDPLLPPKL